MREETVMNPPSSAIAAENSTILSEQPEVSINLAPKLLDKLPR